MLIIFVMNLPHWIPKIFNLIINSVIIILQFGATPFTIFVVIIIDLFSLFSVSSAEEFMRYVMMFILKAEDSTQELANLF